LRAALSLSGAPYAVVPDYASQVEIIEDTRKAAGFLRSMAARGGEIAFDYETFSLKPDSDDSAIRSCAVSWKGKKTIAFPWIGDAIRATSEMLQNPNCKMIAHNAKFEERWTRAVLGHGVTNWNFDTMLAAHFLDNREDTKSLKFQAFALLGQKDYDSHLTDYLKSDDNTGYGINRVKEIPMGQLLLYNGLDALLEFEVAKVQKRQMRGRGIDV
jgi:DNA polymerase I-like protein with 3'-5' exonuclease and polymerase domains